MTGHATLSASDQGLTGAPGGAFNPLSQFFFGVPTFIAPGFEFADAQVYAGWFQPGRACADPQCFYGAPAFPTLELKTNQDGIADSLSSTVTVGGTFTHLPSVPSDPFSFLSFNVSLGVVTETFVSSVPEPGAYAMMLAGLVLIGFVARRRNRDSVSES